MLDSVFHISLYFKLEYLNVFYIVFNSTALISCDKFLCFLLSSSVHNMVFVFIKFRANELINNELMNIIVVHDRTVSMSFYLELCPKGTNFGNLDSIYFLKNPQ